MKNRIAAVLSAGALALATSPVHAEVKTYRWFIILKNGDIQSIEEWKSYSQCNNYATWMRNNLKLKGGSSTAFCVQ